MIVIIGNGIAGITAARNIRKRSDEDLLIISAESKYFFSRTALMYIYMGHMRFQDTQPYENDFWEKNRIDLLQAKVSKIDTVKKSIETDGGQNIDYDTLILATGSKPNRFGWPGQDAEGVQSLYSKQDLDLMEVNTKDIESAVVVGGGLIGIEMAEMLLSRNIEVNYLVRESHFWGNVLPKEDSHFVMKHLDHHNGITFHYEEELDKIITDETNRVSKIVTVSGKEIPAQFVGLTVGVHPNIDLVEGTSIETNKGILVNELLETSEKDVYAIGDCAELRSPSNGRKEIEPVWYTGRFMGETLARTLTGEQTEYNPGIWFNSAKFFDLEYQTYGNVSSEPIDGVEEFTFSSMDGEVFLHFSFDQTTRTILGINTFGMRLRHLIFNQWINDEAPIETVISHLATANFDPEFYKRYERELIQAFNKAYNSNIKPAPKTWWQKLIS
jgi:NADH oxidase (H2O2-forming)